MSDQPSKLPLAVEKAKTNAPAPKPAKPGPGLLASGMAYPALKLKGIKPKR